TGDLLGAIADEVRTGGDQMAWLSRFGDASSGHISRLSGALLTTVSPRLFLGLIGASRGVRGSHRDCMKSGRSHQRLTCDRSRSREMEGTRRKVDSTSDSSASRFSPP